jgi:hypothetical protein
MTDDDYNYDALDEDMSAKDIEAMQLSLERLKVHHAGGELSHLSDEELRTLMHSALSRDLQKTIVR